MSRKTLEVVYDSLTQKEVKDGVVTVVRLSIGDDTYSLDLIPASHEKLMSALAPFIEHEDKITVITTSEAAPAKRRASSGTSKTPSITGEDRARLAAWAETQGESVAKRGRIKASLFEAWEAAGRP